MACCAPSTNQETMAEAEPAPKTEASPTPGAKPAAPAAAAAAVDGDEQQIAAENKKWAKAYDMPENDVCELREGFSLFDKNDEGLIPACEIANVLRAIGQTPTEAEAEQMISDSTQSDDGNITLEEFMRVVGSKGLKTHSDMVEELEEALKVFDKLGKGYIYVDELKQNLLGLGEPLPAEDVAEMMKMGAPTSDGRINYYDFVAKITAKDV